MDEAERRLGEHSRRLEAQEARLRKVEEIVATLKPVPQKLDAIMKTLEDIRAGRPTWSVASLFAALIGIIGVLGTMVAARFGK